jgi:hypothetical protein
VGKSLRCGWLHFLTQVPNRREPKRDSSIERELKNSTEREIVPGEGSRERESSRERAQESSSERERGRSCSAAMWQLGVPGVKAGTEALATAAGGASSGAFVKPLNMVIHVLSNSFIDTHITCCELPTF